MVCLRDKYRRIKASKMISMFLDGRYFYYILYSQLISLEDKNSWIILRGLGVKSRLFPVIYKQSSLAITLYCLLSNLNFTCQFLIEQLGNDLLLLKYKHVQGLS